MESVDKSECVCNGGFSGPNGGVCAPCVAGTYKDTIGSALCKTCPPSTTSAAGSMTVSDCTCIAGYSSAEKDVGTCVVCAADTYKDVKGTESCTPCPANSMSPQGSVSISACTCNMGYYKDQSGVGCTPCPESSLSPPASTSITACICKLGFSGPAGGNCNACQPGTYKPITGSGACFVCASGKYSGASGAIASTTCQQCPDATTSPASSSAVTDCACNKGYSGPAGGPCLVCSAGSYKEVSGSASCTRCPENSESSTNSIFETDCKCKAGYVGPNGGPCSPCMKGTYKTAPGSTGCELFPGHQIEMCECKNTCTAHSDSLPASTAAIDCICNAGYTGDHGSVCEPCAAGTFKNSAGSEPCTACPADSFSPAGSVLAAQCTCNKGYAGLTSEDGVECVACEGGKYNAVKGSSRCVDCPRGKYSSNTAAGSSTTCLECPPGSSSPSGSSALIDCLCEPGSTGSPEEECSLCESGKYKTASSNECEGCPEGHTSPPGSSSPEKCVEICSPGSYGPLGGPCELCPPGKYKAQGGTEECEMSCPANSNSPAGSVSVQECKCNKVSLRINNYYDSSHHVL